MSREPIESPRDVQFVDGHSLMREAWEKPSGIHCFAFGRSDARVDAQHIGTVLSVRR